MPELDGVSDLVNRFYDKQIGRFWSTDLLIEVGQHSFTPYHYSFNNPIRFSDPNGLMGEDCCQSAIDFAAGFVLTAIDNNSPVPTNLAGGGYRSYAYSLGAKVGNIASVVTGAAQVLAGVVGDAAAGSAEVVTVGAATPLAVPLAVGSTAIVLNGIATITKAVTNLNSEGKTPPNPNGAKGKPDHQEKVKELNDKAKSEAKPGERVESEKKIQGHDSNRRPDSQIINENNKTRKIYEAERRPTSQRNKKREAEYDKLGVEHETHKVGGN